jgi:hypothetical protein
MTKLFLVANHRAQRELRVFADAISDYETYLANARPGDAPTLADVRAELDAVRREVRG